MTDKPLSLPEISALIALMAEAKEVSNPELQERYGFTLTNPERKRLNDLKLVDSWKVGRSFTHVLTDLGWARLAEEIRAGIPMPKGSGSAGAALRALLTALQRFMDRTDQRLFEIFAPEESGAATPVPTAESEPPAPPAGSEHEEPKSIEERIRAAYARLARKPGAWVSLTELRPLLGEVDRDEVDETLRRMNRLSDVNLVPESNQKVLSPQDREAAVLIGDQDKHLISIGA